MNEAAPPSPAGPGPDPAPADRPVGPGLVAAVPVASWMALPLVLELVAPAVRDLVPAWSPWLEPASWALAATLTLSGLLGTLLASRSPDTFRRLATFAALVAALGVEVSAGEDPLVALLLAVGLFAFLTPLWGWLDTPALRTEPHPADVRRARLRGVALAAGLSWVGLLLAADEHLFARLGLAAGLATASLLALHALGGLRRPLWRPVAALAALPAAGLVLLPGELPLLWAMPSVLALALVALAPDRRRPAALPGGLTALDAVLIDPARAVFVTFLAGGLTGAVLLALPFATPSGEGLPFIDAAFTAFSAICVTGLITVDTPTAFGPLGQSAILLLIQVGGLGIMTLSTAAFALLGRRMSLRHESAAAELLGSSDRAALHHVLRRILVVTFVSEAAGALVLTGLFLHAGDPLPTALWRGVFTAVSAFCNAGFALQTDSLIPYQAAPAVLLTVSALILVGGLGPLVVAEVGGLLRRARLSVHTRLVLVASALLTVLPAVLIAALEWKHTLAPLGPGDRLVNAFFQSVTLRTAGFNSLDLTQARDATQSLMIPLMFIGGSPGSTAGGIKTTTLAILALMLRATFRNHPRVTAFGHEIPAATAQKAATVSFVGLGVAIAVLLLLQITQVMDLETALFETVSALGTVGLTLGGTAALDLVGKVVIIAAMFAGRVGPLTLLIVLGTRSTAPSTVAHPLAEVEIG